MKDKIKENIFGWILVIIMYILKPITYIFKKDNGQIGILPLISLGSAIVIAAIGGFLAQSRYTDEKIDIIKAENTITIQRLATVEEAIKTIKEDTKTIKSDLREILRLMK